MTTDRKERIKLIVQFYREVFPFEYRAAIQRGKRIRASKASVYGFDKEKEFKHEFSMPSRLFELLDKSLEAPFLQESSEATWFRKSFPEFGGSEKW